MVQQQILLYILSDVIKMNRLWLRWVLYFSIFWIVSAKFAFYTSSAKVEFSLIWVKLHHIYGESIFFNVFLLLHLGLNWTESFTCC